MKLEQQITEQDLDACWPHSKTYLLGILNGEYSVSEALEDIESLIGSEYDARESN